MSTDTTPVVSIRQIKPGDGRKCQREVGLDPGGKAIKCRYDATMLVGDTALCTQHAKERMQVAELMCR